MEENRKGVLFFDRCDLTYLFCGMGNRLHSHMPVVHVAYSSYELNLLKSLHAKGEIVCFEDEIRSLYEKEKPDKELIGIIDDLFIKHTGGRFNLNASIQSDRSFSLLTYDDCLLLAQVYYKYWKQIFESYTFRYLYHEPPSLFFNHLCSVMCRCYQVYYLYHIMSRGEKSELSYLNVTGDNFQALEVENNYFYYSKHTEKIDKKRCGLFLEEFRRDYAVYLGNMISAKKPIFYYWLSGLKKCLSDKMTRKKYHSVVQSVDYWIVYQNSSWEKLHNLKHYKKEIRFDEFDPTLNYYYYSMHLEPEAVVLYLGDGIYTNQVKLIENIAASLPAGCYLYVKDHPHEYGYRSVEDYKRLQQIPNIKLLPSALSGKRIIKNAIGVFTINGTAGFEALLLGKQVYTFGRSFYTVCPRVQLIYNIRELREVLYRNREANYKDDDELYTFVYAYLKSLKIGMVDYFMGRAGKYGVDAEKNLDRIALDFLEFTQKYEVGRFS